MFIIILISPIELIVTTIKIKNIKQSLLNVGTLGHVSHGKTYFIKQLTDKNTNKFTSEKKRGISIKLGYTNCLIFKKKKNNYNSFFKNCIHRQKNVSYMIIKVIKIFQFSFIDCPGHRLLLTTMLSGTALMDSILFFISVNDFFPQEQTIEHLLSLNIYKISKIIVILSKIDLQTFLTVVYFYLLLNTFLERKNIKNKIFTNTFFVDVNLNFILNEIIKSNNCIHREINYSPLFIIIRVFNTKDERKVIGGTLIQGYLQKGLVVELKPGLSENNILKNKETLTKIIEIKDNEIVINFIVPGGLIGLLTEISKTSTCNNNFTGHFVGISGKMPKSYKKILIKYFMFRKLKKQQLINNHKEKLGISRKIITTVNSANVIGVIKEVLLRYLDE